MRFCFEVPAFAGMTKRFSRIGRSQPSLGSEVFQLATAAFIKDDCYSAQIPAKAGISYSTPNCLSFQRKLEPPKCQFAVSSYGKLLKQRKLEPPK